MKTRSATKAKKTAKPPQISRDYVTIEQAARFCDYSQAALDKDAKQKKLKTKKVGKTLMTTPQWLEEYKKQSQKWDDLTVAPKEKISDDLADEIAKELI